MSAGGGGGEGGGIARLTKVRAQRYGLIDENGSVTMSDNQFHKVHPQINSALGGGDWVKYLMLTWGRYRQYVFADITYGWSPSFPYVKSN